MQASEPVIFSWSNRPESGQSCPGDDDALEFDRLDDGRGNLTFPIVGSHSQSQFINSFADTCDIISICRQAELAENPGLLIRDGGHAVFGDVSSYSDNMVDIMNGGKAAIEFWNKNHESLPFDTFDDFIDQNINPEKIKKIESVGETNAGS